MNQDRLIAQLVNIRAAPRCGAKTRVGGACQCPAIRDRKRCRLHGGRGSGAPKGRGNGNYKDGYRLKTALGTASMEFVEATLYQLQAAARLPYSGVSEIAVNAALAMIESEQPRNETECAIVVQMACLHAATMAVLGRIGGGHGADLHVLAAATAASRLSRTFAILVETLRRLRNG